MDERAGIVGPIPALYLVRIMCAMRSLADSLAELRAFREGLNRTADAIAGRSPEQWAGWVVYLLEALEGKGDPETYEAFLDRLYAHIGRRIEDGEW